MCAVILACRTGVIFFFCVFQANGGERESRARGEARARLRSPEKRKKKITPVLQASGYICYQEPSDHLANTAIGRYYKHTKHSISFFGSFLVLRLVPGVSGWYDHQMW